jgi:hypothetical protein
MTVGPAVHDELTIVLGWDAIADPTVTKYLRQRKLPSIVVDRRGIINGCYRSGDP